MFFVPIPKVIAKERGLKFYSTGKPCPKGNIANRTFNTRCTCIDCKQAEKERSSNYYSLNKETVKEKSRAWAKNNKEQHAQRCSTYAKNNRKAVSSKQKEWCEKNKEHVTAYKVKYRSDNKERLNQLKKEWSLKNKEKVRLAQKKSDLKHIEARKLNLKKWIANNKDRRKSYKIKRKAVVRSAKVFNHELTDFIVSEIVHLNKLRENLTKLNWHLDHMIPLQAENVCGLHVWNNFQCLPSNINHSKGNKLIYTNPHEWLYDIPKFFKVVYQQEIAA